MEHNEKNETKGYNCSNERLKIWLSFARFILGSVLVTIIGLLINSSLKLREIENKEMKLVGTYIEYALTKEVGDRKRFSEYFAAVIRSKEQRKRWITYDSLITIEFNEMIRIKDSLTAIENAETIKKEDEIKQEKANKDLSEDQIQDKIDKIEIKYEQKISDIQNQLSETKVKLKVSPLTDPTSEVGIPVLTYTELKDDYIAQLIVKFLVKYSPDCFNSARIQEWGQKQKGFSKFYDIGIAQIQTRLDALYSFGVINKGKCRTKSLFSVSKKSDPLLISFIE